MRYILSCCAKRCPLISISQQNGEYCLLENVRFYAEEEKNNKEFSKKLAAPFDMYVNDAFGTAHRAHSSTAGVTEFLSPSVAGFLLQKELDYLEVLAPREFVFLLALLALTWSAASSLLQGAVSEPKRPFAAIVGGSKVRPPRRLERGIPRPPQATHCKEPRAPVAAAAHAARRPRRTRERRGAAARRCRPRSAVLL